jgi:ArsR family transcriptional regulator, arsenate/arsenite/antimonite-responsive transcriptional repressor
LTGVKEPLFNVIADPWRCWLLKPLEDDPMTAGWIAEEFEMSKSTLSYHVDILKQSDLVRCE